MQAKGLLVTMDKKCLIKIIGIILVLSVIISVCSLAVLSAETIDCYERFDNNLVDGFDIPWGNAGDDFGASITDDKVLKTWVSNTRPIKVTHEFGSVINEGMFYIAFDYKTTQTYNDSYLRLVSGDKQYQICGFRNTGKFGHFKKFSVWALEDTAVSYLPETWYTCGVLFDMESRYAYFYFGKQGEVLDLIETAEIPTDFGNITDMVLVHSFGDYTPALWDNVRVNSIDMSVIDAVEKREKLKFDDGIYRKYLDALCDEDFDDTFLDVAISGWTEADKSNGMMRINEDENFVAKTWVDDKYPKRITHIFDNPVKSGVYYIAFDWKSDGDGNDCFVRLTSGDKQYQICGFRNDGRFGRFNNFSNWSLNTDYILTVDGNVKSADNTSAIPGETKFRTAEGALSIVEFGWYGEDGKTPATELSEGAKLRLIMKTANTTNADENIFLSYSAFSGNAQKGFGFVPVQVKSGEYKTTELEYTVSGADDIRGIVFDDFLSLIPITDYATVR